MQRYGQIHRGPEKSNAYEKSRPSPSHRCTTTRDISQGVDEFLAVLFGNGCYGYDRFLIDCLKRTSASLLLKKVCPVSVQRLSTES